MVEFGDETTSRALRDLVLLGRSFGESPHVYRELTGKDIYLAFRRHISPAEEDKLRSLFNRWQGNPMANFNAYVDDDHGDTLGKATPLDHPGGTQGALEQPLDRDFFRFDASKEQELKIAFENLSGSEDFIIWLHSPGIEHAELLGHPRGIKTGTQVQWRAPTAGEYGLSVESLSGTTCAYRLEVGTAGQVDYYGNDSFTATEVVPGMTVFGNIEHEADADYFVLDAKADHGYTINIWHSSLGYSQVVVYWPDGSNPWRRVQQFAGSVGSGADWRNEDSGKRYIRVDTIPGNIGEYNLTITEFPPDQDDHGDFPETATPISLVTTTPGTFEHRFDHDLFRFSAEEGQWYNIKIEPMMTSFKPAVVLAPDGTTSLLERFVSISSITGAAFSWQAPTSGHHFVKLRAGYKGDYSLTIVPAAENSEDHSDFPTAATALVKGRQVSGELDRKYDLDYFQLEVTKGSKYVVATDFGGDPLALYTILLGGDGVTLAPFVAERLVRSGGVDILWHPQESGLHYVLLYSPEGEVVPYSLTIKAEG